MVEVIENRQAIQLYAGGKTLSVILSVIGGIITFVFGFIDGFTNPKACNAR